MLSRCYNKNSHNYRRYGERGIKVCKRWQEYENFLIDMGRRPGKGYSIDRINNDGNYEPGNCRWADRQTASQQPAETSEESIASWATPAMRRRRRTAPTCCLASSSKHPATNDFVDLTDATITVGLRLSSQTAPSLTATTGNGHITVTGPGTFTVHFTRAEMATFPPGDADVGITVRVDGVTLSDIRRPASRS